MTCRSEAGLLKIDSGLKRIIMEHIHVREQGNTRSSTETSEIRASKTSCNRVCGVSDVSIYKGATEIPTRSHLDPTNLTKLLA